MTPFIFKVSATVVRGWIIGPMRHYLHNYRMINWLLDQTAHLSHKMIAIRAGIGWIGRNNLLLHPEYGSKIRLATILTDMPLKTDYPVERDCGSCRKCIEICPVSAIKDTHHDWNKTACLEKLKYFAREHNVGQYICGLCVKA